MPLPRKAERRLRKFSAYRVRRRLSHSLLPLRAVVRRVLGAKVKVDGSVVGEIAEGVLVYLGVSKEDDVSDLNWLSSMLAGLRVFDDRAGRMNLSVLDVSGELLVVSQFTLFGNVRKGFRPSFNRAA